MDAFRKEKDVLLVYGYMHNQSFFNKLQIPIEIIEICLKFFMEIYQIQQFTDDIESHYRSSDGLLLTENRTCVRRVFDNSCKWEECRYILADIEPLTTGIHCWRIQVL